jgi:Gnt-I system high-affinity gluconate transporter
LMVLAVGAGSLLFSHVNDTGFWLFKEYLNLSVKDTIRSWSIMETIVAVVGLIGVLILNALM